MDKVSGGSVPASVLAAIPFLIDFPSQRFWVDYDQEADVLYISFQRPQRATNTEMTEDGLLLRYRQGKLVGVTVLDASTRLQRGNGAVVGVA